MENKSDFGLIFWAHLLLVIVSYSSPLWLDWRVVVLGVVVLKLHYAVNGNCFLTTAELGRDNDRTFAWFYLNKIFPGLDEKKTKHIVRNVVPIVLVAAAIILQVILGYTPSATL